MEEEETLSRALGCAEEAALYAMQFNTSDNADAHQWSPIGLADITTLKEAFAAAAELGKSIIAPVRIVRLSRYGTVRRHLPYGDGDERVVVEPVIHSVIKYQDRVYS